MPVGHITIRDINDALPRALPKLLLHGIPITASSAANARPTIEWPGVFITEYTNPMRNVLFDAKRDANPFFHYLEAMWILAGRNDVKTLGLILPKMADYSDDGETFHGAYGHRLRHWPDLGDNEMDQLEASIQILRNAPTSRQVVMGIWNPALDLGAQTKDMPCNDLIMLKVRNGALNVTVCNRSNDAIWGCYGANAVQFSMLTMYIAARLGVKVGVYMQVSDSFHVYEDNLFWQSFKDEYAADPDSFEEQHRATPYNRLGDSNLFEKGIETFDAELKQFWQDAELHDLDLPLRADYQTPAVADAAFIHNAQQAIRAKDFKMARLYLDQMHASDWQLGCQQWMNRREGKSNV